MSDESGNRAGKLRALPEKVRPRLRRAIGLGVLAGAAVFLSQLGNPYDGAWEAKLVAWVGAFAFMFLAFGALISFGGEIRRVVGLRVGPIHATIVRLTIVLTGGVIVVIVGLSLLDLPISQLVLGGALTGAIIGIAGQQTLANLFAGVVLLYSRPFEIGDHILARSGPLGGDLEGRVVEIGLVYVTLESNEGEVSVPNAIMQSAAVLRPPDGKEPGPGTQMSLP